MIKNEHEYKEAVGKLDGERARMLQEKQALFAAGHTAAEVDRLLQPVQTFHEQLKEEVHTYERLCRGEFDALRNFDGIGRALIALRIFVGLSQRELAEEMAVHESQVSRDERNEYHGITVDRVNRVLEALGAELTTSITPPAKRPPRKRVKQLQPA